MTTSTEMFAACAAIENRIAEMGYIACDVALHVNWLGSQFVCHIEHKAAKHESHESEFMHADTVEEAIEGANAYLDGLPTVKEKQRHNFMAALGKLIDQGREVDIDVEFINPLETMMKKLAENAITDQSEDA